MSWILVCGAVFCGWAMLRTMGAERERRIVEQRHATSPPAPPPAANPVRIAAGMKRAPARTKAKRSPRQAA